MYFIDVKTRKMLHNNRTLTFSKFSFVFGTFLHNSITI